VRALALADEFLRTHAERQITDPTRRAILQRDLWAVFNWADQSDHADLPLQAERHELMTRMAPVIRRLALSPDEFPSLPDTYARALEGHEFPPRVQSGQPQSGIPAA
jgi:hypothetical protein